MRCLIRFDRMNYGQRHTRRFRSCGTLKRRTAEYRKRVSTVDRSMHRLQSVTVSDTKKLRRIRRELTNALSALDRAAGACNWLGEHALSENLRTIRSSLIAAYPDREAHSNADRIREAYAALGPLLIEGFDVLRVALRRACPDRLRVLEAGQ